MRLLKKIPDSKYFIRGKYQLWFFIKSVKCIHSMSHKINDDIKKLNQDSIDSAIKKMNVSINVDESNIFDLLPMKIDRHNDVNIFLIQNIQKIDGKY